MVSFKFIETFLFLSLGITFALIVTLVYHFKKRMENMEQKCDTMFDIVQNLANEVIHLKTTDPNNDTLNVDSGHPNNVNYQLQEDGPTSVLINDLSGETAYDDSSEEEESGDDESSEESGDEDTDDEADDAVNDIIKMTIPDIRVINMNDEITIDEIADMNDMSDDLGVEIIDETDVGELLELSEITEINISKLSDEQVGLDDDDEDDGEEDGEETELTTNDNGDTVLTKSALRKIKIANLRTMALSKGVEVDDTMKKSDIIELIMTN